jgi:SAM-dependent methyltransferase
MSTHPYLLANADVQAADRFTALSALFDRASFAAFERLGLGAGWRCWEVGAGGPLVAAEMARRVGATGHVTASDIDTRWLTDSSAEFEVIAHDVAKDAPPAQDFDLVHARLVLSHVPERAQALRNMVSSLKPGGFLVIEDFDSVTAFKACLEDRTAAEKRANRIRDGFGVLLAQRGADRALGSKLPRLLGEAGLKNITAEARMPIAPQSTLLLERANVAQTAPALVKNGLATQAEINDHLAAVDSGEIQIVFPLMFTVSGRK